MKFEFHPEAEKELYAAIDYYEDCNKGLGYDFAIEVHSAIDRIITYPKAWPVLEDEIRRCLTRRFPFGILYSIESDNIYILAIMNLHREPDYWKHRTDG